MSLFLPALFSCGRVEKLIERDSSIVEQKTIPCPPANSASSIHVRIQIGVFWREFVAVFAVRPRSFYLDRFCSGLLQRISLSDICALFFSRCPNAIIRAISFFVIFPLDRHFEWARPHILNKVFEPKATRFNNSPPFTYGYASPPPILEVWALWVFASLNHIGPSPIKRLQGFVSHA